MASDADLQNLIPELMPKFRLRQTDQVRVRYSPEKAWPIVRNMDTYELPISRFLFSLRTLPENLVHKLKGQKTAAIQHSRIDDFTGPGKGFQILAENPGSEIVVGSIGKFWKPKIEFVDFQSHEFHKFRKPGYAKLAWNLRLDPDLRGGSWLTWELRVTATDNESWQKFQKYWLLIGNFSHLLRRMALKRLATQLGGQVSEEELKLSGDEFVKDLKFQKTMAKTINVPAKKLWPWLVQMGCQRAGWYSIDWLDNGSLMSASRIIPELQHIQIGDILPWKPTGKEGFEVLSIDKNKSLVLGSPSITKGKEEKFADSPVVTTWSFSLEPIGKDSTRLITRVRGEVQPGHQKILMRSFLGLAHFIMESAQLKNLKQRAEGSA